jgi:Domain of unknown function (DUF4136)
MINKFVTLLLSALFLSSCSTIMVDVEYDDTLTFNNLHRYSWIPGTPEKSNNPQLDSDTILHDRIRGSINNWFAGHGYEKIDIEQADFLIAYYVTVKDKTKVTVLNDYYGYPSGWGSGYYRPYGATRSYAYEYQQGAIIIDIIDPTTRKLMWRGSATDEVDESKVHEKGHQKIKEAIDKILANFPPSK